MKPSSVVSTQTYLHSNPPSVALSTLTNSNSMSYYYSLWIYVNNLNQGATGSNNQMGGFPSGLTGRGYKEANNIFYIVDSKTKPFVSLDINDKAELMVSLVIKGNLISFMISPNFPLQRWEHIIINVNNSLIEIYLDGKLIRSLKSPTPPATPTVNSSIFFGTGDIFIAQLHRNLFLYDANLAYNTYIKGNNGYRVTPYSATFSLLKNNEPTYNYQIW
jgi:hypothetical protein